jgi:hypothetical protein
LMPCLIRILTFRILRKNKQGIFIPYFGSSNFCGI